MTTKAQRSGNRVKDLVVTAAVASVVSALVAPWVRRWMDGGGMGFGPQPGALPPGTVQPQVDAVDDYAMTLERLLDVPNSFPPNVGAAFAPRRASMNTNRREDDDDDVDDDLGP